MLWAHNCLMTKIYIFFFLIFNSHSHSKHCFVFEPLKDVDFLSRTVTREKQVMLYHSTSCKVQRDPKLLSVYFFRWFKLFQYSGVLLSNCALFIIFHSQLVQNLMLEFPKIIAEIWKNNPVCQFIQINQLFWVNRSGPQNDSQHRHMSWWLWAKDPKKTNKTKLIIKEFYVFNPTLIWIKKKTVDKSTYKRHGSVEFFIQ